MSAEKFKVVTSSESLWNIELLITGKSIKVGTNSYRRSYKGSEKHMYSFQYVIETLIYLGSGNMNYCRRLTPKIQMTNREMLIHEFKWMTF